MAALVTARGELILDEIGRAKAAVHTAAEKLRKLRARDKETVMGQRRPPETPRRWRPWLRADEETPQPSKEELSVGGETVPS